MCMGGCFFPSIFISPVEELFISGDFFFFLFFFFFYLFFLLTLPPEGEITNPQKAEWHVLKRWTKYKYLKMYFMVIMSGFMALAQY